MRSILMTATALAALGGAMIAASPALAEQQAYEVGSFERFRRGPEQRRDPGWIVALGPRGWATGNAR